MSCLTAYDEHDCSVPGACTKALLGLLARTKAHTEAERKEREDLIAAGTEIRAIR